jgi:hypothetical protein
MGPVNHFDPFLGFDLASELRRPEIGECEFQPGMHRVELQDEVGIRIAGTEKVRVASGPGEFDPVDAEGVQKISCRDPKFLGRSPDELISDIVRVGIHPQEPFHFASRTFPDLFPDFFTVIRRNHLMHRFVHHSVHAEIFVFRCQPVNYWILWERAGGETLKNGSPLKGPHVEIGAG